MCIFVKDYGLFGFFKFFYGYMSSIVLFVVVIVWMGVLLCKIKCVNGVIKPGALRARLSLLCCSTQC